MPENANSYKQIRVNGVFFRIPAFFLMFTPFRVPYGKAHQLATKQGFTLKTTSAQEFNGILEKPVSFGRGWIAVEIEPPASEHPRVFRFEGDFQGYLHIGPYSKIGKAYKQIMKDNPRAKEFYNLYMNDPKVARPSDLRTLVLFR